MIVIYILIIAVACVMLIVIRQLARTNESIANIATAHNQLVANTKESFRNVGKSLGELRANQEDPQIQEILDRLNKVTDDITRIDAEVDRIAKDEKEIRSYYVNFREPVVAEDIAEIEELDLPFPGDEPHEDQIIKYFKKFGKEDIAND